MQRSTSVMFTRRILSGGELNSAGCTASPMVYDYKHSTAGNKGIPSCNALHQCCLLDGYCQVRGLNSAGCTASPMVSDYIHSTAGNKGIPSCNALLCASALVLFTRQILLGRGMQCMMGMISNLLCPHTVQHKLAGRNSLQIAMLAY